MARTNQEHKVDLSGPKIPGKLELGNMRYAEGLRRQRQHAGPGLLMIGVTTNTAAGQSFPRYTQRVYVTGMPQQPYTCINYHQGAEPNGTQHLHLPMVVDEANAPGRDVWAAFQKCVDCAKDHWRECKRKGKEGKVLLYCAEGQNRSAAVGLAALLAHGVGLGEAMRRLTAADTEYWTKFVGPGGQRLKNIVTQALAPEPKYYYKVREYP